MTDLKPVKKHYTIKVSGRVQGVFFRASAADQAKGFDVTGFVRNERDGSVYIEAEGEDNELEQFLNWCRKGPSAAKVERCEVEERPVKNFTTFEIQRY